MNYDNIELSLVVGWPEVKLMSNSRFLWCCCARREPGLWFPAIV